MTDEPLPAAERGERLYRTLVRLAPRRFRRAFGPDLSTLATELMRREADRTGRAAAWRLRLRLLGDLAGTLVAEHWASRRRPARRQRRPSPSRRLSMFAGLSQDLRDAVRTLRRSPGYSFAVALTLALGIGANAAVFSVVHAVLLRPLPFDDPDRLVLLAETNAERGWDRAQVAPANFLDWREQSQAFSAMAGFSDWADQQTLLIGDEAVSVRSKFAAGDLFGVLGTPMALGRSFRDDELWANNADVVVLSHETWRGLFSADPHVVGRACLLNGRSRTVIGVLPAGFVFDGAADLWQPFGWRGEARTEVWFRRAHMFRGVARLAPGTTLGEAQQEMRTIAARLDAAYPETNRGMGVVILPLSRYLIGGAAQPLAVLFVGVGLVLLVACVNVAHLQLARAIAQAREDGLRDCLGASPWRQLRRRLTESLVLSAIGAAAGAAFAWAMTPALVRFAGDALPSHTRISTAGVVALFVALTTLVAALAAGLAPALAAVRARLDDTLRENRGGESRRRGRLHQALIGGEIALAAILVAGALLLVRSLGQLTDVDPGFDGRGVLTAGIAPPPGTYADDAATAGVIARVMERARSIPGVEAVGATRSLPLTGDSWSGDFAVRGRGREDYGVGVLVREATPGYLEALRVPLLGGRDVGSGDIAGAPLVVLVNAAFAKQYFPGGDPIGHVICFDRYPDQNSIWRTIVGVTGDVMQSSLRQPARPEIVMPLAQDPTRRVKLLVRSPLPPTSLAEELRRAVLEVDPQMPLFEVQAMASLVREASRRERFLLTLFGGFAVLALLLAALGVYGVTAHGAQRRRREIGVRLALGALPGDVERSLLQRGLVPVAIGLVVGTGGALALGRWMGNLLYGIGGADPWSLGLAPLVLLLTAVVAMWIPLHRAARTPPAIVLRAE